jgi:acetylornithine/N-succinyldiaminopimelate aminotransferase
VAEACVAQGLLVSLAGNQVIRFSPPLTVRDADVDEALGQFARALERAA